MENQEVSKFRNPLEYLRVFFRRKWLFASPIFVCLVISIMACFLLPPLYESSTTIMVEEEKIINPLIQNLAISTAASQRMDSIREVLLGWNSLVELTSRLDLAKNIKTQVDFEGFIEDLRDNISVRMKQWNVIVISYVGGDPQQTQLVAETLTDILVSRNMESQTRETDVAIDFIQEQLVIYKRKIKESEISDLEDQLKNLLIDSTEQHPVVIELRQRLDSAKADLKSGEFDIAVSGEPVSESARKALKTQLDRIIETETRALTIPSNITRQPPQDSSDAIYKLLLMDKVGTSNARDIDVNERIYQMLLERLETAKITQRLEVSKEGTRYTIIDPARLPLKPTQPNRIKVIFLGLMLGGFAGTSLVFSREFLDRSFLDIEDAKQELNAPVLGAISRVTTQREIDKEKNRRITLVTVSLVVSFLLIILSMLISMIRK
ncbi:MAG: GNVR domain-containing protein [Candidatus Omnitrophota bacterium]